MLAVLPLSEILLSPQKYQGGRSDLTYLVELLKAQPEAGDCVRGDTSIDGVSRPYHILHTGRMHLVTFAFRQPFPVFEAVAIAKCFRRNQYLGGENCDRPCTPPPVSTKGPTKTLRRSFASLVARLEAR